MARKQHTAPVTIHLISARNGEFVGFTSSADAGYTAEGRRAGIYGTPTLGENFRESYATSERAKFPAIRVTLTAEQANALRIPVPKK